MPKGVEHNIVLADFHKLVGPRNSVMPKGVEHRTYKRDGTDFKRPRNSLMPKGVEHFATEPSCMAIPTAKLRDAERR
jgi:hypothetical protein